MINSLDWLKILAVSSSLLKTLLVAYPQVIIKTADVFPSAPTEIKKEASFWTLPRNFLSKAFKPFFVVMSVLHFIRLYTAGYTMPSFTINL